MATKIKFSFLKMLFRLFSFLADKTNGAKIFAKPKILLGTLLLGSVVVACKPKAAQTTCYEPAAVPDNDAAVLCYEPVVDDTVKSQAQKTFVLPENIEVSCYEVVEVEPIISCYVQIIEQNVDTTQPLMLTEQPIDTIQPLMFAEQMPEFIGGETELINFVSNNVRYPLAAQELGIQGKVVVRFVVKKDGNIGEIQIVKSLHPACDREAIRLVKSMPKWQAGKQNGENIDVWFTLPIRFKLEE